MSLTKVASDGIEALAITNAHLHTAANIAHSKLADSGASAGSYGSSTAIPSVTVNAKGIVTSISQTSIDTDLLADSTPQLGGSLDVNDFNILNGTAILDITENTRFEFNIGGTEYLDINAGGIDVTGNITVTGTVDGRDVASDGTKLDGIESNATADQSASEILTLLKTVDGAGSGLDKVIEQNSKVPKIVDIIVSPEIYIPLLAFISLILISIILRKFFYKN